MIISYSISAWEALLTVCLLGYLSQCQQDVKQLSIQMGVKLINYYVGYSVD